MLELMILGKKHYLLWAYKIVSSWKARPVLFKMQKIVVSNLKRKIVSKGYHPRKIIRKSLQEKREEKNQTIKEKVKIEKTKNCKNRIIKLVLE